jgi:hypothetical protein
MIISVDTSRSAAVELSEPDDFKGFKVVVRQADSDQLAAALEGVAAVEPGGEAAFVEIEALKGLAGDRASDPEWLGSLDGMVAYAQTKGWMSDDGSSIQAHVEHDG